MSNTKIYNRKCANSEQTSNSQIGKREKQKRRLENIGQKTKRIAKRSFFRKSFIICLVNYRKWHKNPKIILTFALGFIVSFLLSDKVMAYTMRHNTIMQVTEPFIWTFGDAQSLLIISLFLLLLFSDMPNLENEVPFMLSRISRFSWMFGQILYILSATFIYVGFIFLSTCILSASKVYMANMWSETAAVIGYSKISDELMIPSFVKVMERTYPYQCACHVLCLMLGYSFLLAGIILYFNMYRKKGGMMAGIIFSAFNIICTPDNMTKWLKIGTENQGYAKLILGWISPLNHATYYMHSFGYDSLPKLNVSYIYFGVSGLIMCVLSLLRIKKYQFDFDGTERI